jgi:hypothetical protein
MQRKKYKITNEEYRIFKNQHLMNLLTDSRPPQRYGQAFLQFFPEVLDEYQRIGGDFGEAEAELLWNENDVARAEQYIMNWVVL